MTENNIQQPKKPTTKAYVLKNGDVIDEKTYLNKFAIKGTTSQQLPPDLFAGVYNAEQLVEPLYSLESLAQLLDVNTYHNRAVRTKAKDTAGLGWKFEGKRGIKNPRKQQRSQIEQVLDQMDIEGNLTEVLDKMMTDYEATGNGYLEVIRNVDNKITGLVHIPAHTVRRHTNKTTYAQMVGVQRAYFKEIGCQFDIHAQLGTEHPLNSLPIEDQANEIIHFANYSPLSDYYGIPDILPAIGAIMGDSERQNYNVSFFENHAVPAYVVTVEGTELDLDTQAAIRNYFQNEVKNSRHSTLVLTAQKDPSDLTSEPVKFNFQALTQPVTDAAFTQFRKDNRDEILAAHGVPAYRIAVNETGSLGGSTAAESTEIYKQSVIKPRQKMIEDVINKYIVWENGAVDWVFKFNEIDTTDEKHDMEMIEKAIKMGIMTPNEARVKLGLETVEQEGMDSFYMEGTKLDQPKVEEPITE